MMNAPAELWFVFASLVGIAVLFVVMALRGPATAAAGRTAGSVAILGDQLAEVDRDAERGLISEDEARAARVEIKRRILAAGRASGAAAAGRQGGAAALWLAALLVPVAGGLLYSQLGAPGVPSLAYADRAGERDEEARISELTDRLLERLQSDPEGGPREGWELLAQTYMRMGRHEDAAAALERVTGRPDATSATLSRYAEALIARENGIVTPPAQRAIDRARALDPSNPAAVYYAAIALDQAGDSAAAHDALIDRLNRADGPEPWMEAFIDQANRIGETLGRDRVDPAAFAPMAGRGAAPGPDAEDVAAASRMDQGERADFIRSMVERLAARLQDQPDDLDGWMRLGNAYRALDQMAQARDAYRRASALAQDLAPTDPRRQSIRQALDQLGG